MPIYEYKCDQCDHQLEKLQKISDAPAKTCPKCDKNSLRKLVSIAAFKLKGSGWYETDFKDKKPEKDTHPSSNGKAVDSKKLDNTDKESLSKNKETTKPSASSPSFE